MRKRALFWGGDEKMFTESSKFKLSHNELRRGLALYASLPSKLVRESALLQVCLMLVADVVFVQDVQPNRVDLLTL